MSKPQTDETQTPALAPAGWPANQLPEITDPWERYRDADRAAGIEITPDFRRFSQRNDMFNRSRWDEAVRGAAAKEFFTSHHQPKPRKGDGFRARDFALRNASWALANEFAERGFKEGQAEGFLDPVAPHRPPAKTKAEPESPEKTAAEIKKIAKIFGAHIVGITDYDERWVYASRFDMKTHGDRPNELPEGLTSVIVLGHGMDYALIRSMPSALASAAVGNGYSSETRTAVLVSQYIRNLGYEAVASMNDTALAIPYAIKAGLGEYGRNQMVITPEFGPRVRFSKIFTDLPLAHDRPRPFGVTQFCAICERCADACPPKAIPHGPPSDVVHNRSSHIGVKKWTADCEKCFGYWTKLKTDCAICMRVCPYNKDFSRWPMRLARRLAGTRARKFMLWLDDKLGYGKRVAPKDWWADTP